MSFNKNNPIAMGKIVGYLKQLSNDMGTSEQQRRKGDEERLYKAKGPKYARVPSRPTLSASTTCTSLATSCGSSATLAPNIYSAIPEHVTTESSSEDEQETFEKTRKHFQQLRQISLGNDFKLRMEMETKSAKGENLRNSVPFIKTLGSEPKEYAINGEKSPYAPTTQKIFLWTQILAALAVSMGSLVVGFSSGYTSPALPSMNATLPLSADESSWISGVMPLAGLAGGISGGFLVEYLGRRNTIIASALPFFIGWILIATASSVPLIIVGRAITGISVGIGSLAYPVYLGETIQPEIRGILGLLPTAFGNIGMLVTYVLGVFLNWSELAFVGAALPMVFLALLMLIPETPRWYISRNETEKARRALKWLRGKNADTDSELQDVVRSHTESERNEGSAMRQLFSRMYARPVIIALGLMLFQQLSGINAVVYYTQGIFKESNSGLDEKWCTVIVGLVNFVSTFIATTLIERLGRKVLLYISAVSVIITLTTLGAFFYVSKQTTIDVSSYGWVPLASMIIFVLGFSLGLGPIPWLMLGEILPAKIRGTAASVATAFNFACVFLVTKTFPDVVNSIGMYGAFWLFASITIIGLVFVIVMVPETKGKTLEEIERKLIGGTRRIKSAKTKQATNGYC